MSGAAFDNWHWTCSCCKEEVASYGMKYCRYCEDHWQHVANNDMVACFMLHLVAARKAS